MKYTKMVLRESLIEILQEKPIQRVSVTEVCKAAPINRGTFYAHYADVYALLSQIEGELFDELERAIAAGEDTDDFDRVVRGIITVIARNREVCRVILGENGRPQFVARILEMARGCYHRSWACRAGVCADAAEDIFRFLSAGSMEVLRRWMQKEDRRSQDEIARIISEISKSIIAACLIRADAAGI
ncbi:MAG: TetR/AcrR family transcriptional regulator [Christensenellales bacterium]